MKKVHSLIFSNQCLDIIIKKKRAYKDQQVSWGASIILLMVYGLWWLLCRPESDAWQSVIKNNESYFPNDYFRKPTLSNLIRYPIQALWLCVFKPYAPQKQIIKTYWERIQTLKSSLYKKTIAHFLLCKNKITNVINPLKLNKVFILNHLILLKLLLATSILLIFIGISRYFSNQEQLIFFITLWLVALILKKIPGQLALLTLVLMSVIASSRYLWWRYSTTLVWFNLQSEIFGVLLIFAETYVTLVLILGYFQSLWPLNRQPVKLPKDPNDWPSVDVMIATYNESLDIVKLGIYAALGMDWPQEKLNIYLLDDGNRPEFKKFAQEVNVNYIARSTNEHAKAGNINHALKKTSSEFIAFFDCDFITTRAFLQLTMGCFLQDKKMAFIQTPHHFFSEDPFERNLNPSHKVPN